MRDIHRYVGANCPGAATHFRPRGQGVFGSLGRDRV